MTTIKQINQIIQTQKQYFNTQKTKPIEFRLEQLKKLKIEIQKNEKEIQTALNQDLKKSKTESYISEIGYILNEIEYSIKNLKNWSKPKKVSSKTIPFSKSQINSEPLGTILIISPWNYPFQLTISPLIGSIAAGNTSIIKPSEIAKNTSKLLKKIIQTTFDEKYITVIEGNAKTAQNLLKHKFDHIFYTGSENVGKIILENAAKHLTPTTLELGGKTPTIIDIDANLEKTANRITFGKFLNAGQTCVAPDYLLVNSQIKTQLIQKIKTSIKNFYSTNPANSNDYGKIINQTHFKRLNSYIKQNQNQIIFGGKTDQKTLYIEPTLIQINQQNVNTEIMQEEIFGPILPILEYKNLDDAINYINSKPKPLALYIFSENKEIQQKIINQTSSGGICINDTIIHLANPELPFGGVGNSGFGKYHGKHTFDLFSNKKSILQNTTKFEIPKRYPPYSKLTLKIIKKFF